MSFIRIRFIWLAAAAVLLAIAACVFAGLFKQWSRQAALSAIPPVDARMRERMSEICVFPQTLHTRDELAAVYAAGSGAHNTPVNSRHVPVLLEPYPLLAEVQAAIGKADLTDGAWMEWKENANDPANANWYLRMTFDPESKLKQIAVRTSTKGSNGCKEERIGRTADDWSVSIRDNAVCGPDCR